VVEAAQPGQQFAQMGQMPPHLVGEEFLDRRHVVDQRLVGHHKAFGLLGHLGHGLGPGLEQGHDAGQVVQVEVVEAPALQEGV